MHLEEEFLLLWEMSLLQLPIPHPTVTTPGAAAPLDSTGMPSILSALEKLPQLLYFLFPFFFLTL